MGLAVGSIQLAQLNQAFKATLQAQLNYSNNNSVWPLAHTWHSEQHKMLKAYHQGTYRLSPQTTYIIKRAIATQIKEQLSSKFSNTIMHLKGHGSIKGVLRHISALLPQFNYFYKTDMGLIQIGHLLLSFYLISY